MPDFHCATCNAPFPRKAPQRQQTAASFEKLFADLGWSVTTGAPLCPAHKPGAVTSSDTHNHRAWCARKVEAEDALAAVGSKLDVWPAGWPREAIEAARAIGRAHLARVQLERAAKEPR